VISRNTTLTWLVDLDPLKVEVKVPERFLSQVLPGQELSIDVAAWPERTFKGEVYFVSPYVDPESRTMLVKARVPNSDAQLKPGMFAGIELTLKVRANALVISETAINQVLDDNRAVIMLVNEQSQVEAREIKLGLRLEGSIEVVEGLSDGEQVIVEGLQKIGPGMTVKVAPAEAMKPNLPAARPAGARS
jgi:membrane fusion protein (multidrug efflux system)